jgi:integrase
MFSGVPKWFLQNYGPTEASRCALFRSDWFKAGQLNSGHASVTSGSVAVRDKRSKAIPRRRHQKGTVQERNGVYREIYRKYAEGKPTAVPLGTAEGMTKRKAAAKLQDIIRKMEEKAPYVIPQPQSADDVMTVRKYIEGHYMQEFWPNLKPGTRKGYKQVIDAHIIPTLGTMELSKVTRSDIQLMITKLRPTRTPGQPKLARNTFNNIRTVLGSIFRDAELGKFIAETPVYKIKMPPKDPKKKVVIPRADVVQAVVDSLNEPYQTLTWFVATMGCRVGEAFGLKWGAVDLKGKRIWFLEVRYLGKEAHLTKGHRADKPVYLSDYEVVRLKEFKASCEHQDDNDLVFLDHGEPLTEDHALQQELQKGANKFGLHLTFHGLRHWAGTMLYRAGVPLEDIQARLGHSCWQTTADWYIEENDAGQQNAAEIASCFMRPVVVTNQPVLDSTHQVHTAATAISPVIATKTATSGRAVTASA